jgi:aspartate 1-decarboxylase
MLKTVVCAKLQGLTITDKKLYYAGSIQIDEKIIDKSGIVLGEKVQVVNLYNGERFETYVIAGKPGSGVIGLRGPAARLGEIGDKITVIAYGIMDEAEARKFKPKILNVRPGNKV